MANRRASTQPREVREPVVLVHGLWMHGAELGVLRQRLQSRHGFDAYVFPYATMRGSAARIGDDLADFALKVGREAGCVHLLGHSLGGAIVYRALESGLRDVPGRAVMLGAPLNGSRAARGASRFAMLRPLLGPHVLQELAHPVGRRWQRKGPRSLGAIAGSRRIGFGQFFAHYAGDEENDGTVAVEETIIPGLDDHVVLPHSHMGMLFANEVTDQVAHFLRHGCFQR